MMTFIAGGIFERHPALRVQFLEAGCGWVPFWLERMQHVMTGQWSFLEVSLSLTAREYFHRNCLVAMATDEYDVIPGFLDVLGADNLCWSTDFPHPDHDWRGMRHQFLDRPEISIDDKRKIMGSNAARAYGLKA